MTTVAAAKESTSSSKPAGMYCSTWRHLQTVLRALTKYLPDPFPSTRQLARRTQLDHADGQPAAHPSRGMGFIARTPRVTATGHQSYSYALLFVANRVANATEEELRSSPSEKNSLSSYGGGAAKEAPRRCNRWSGPCAVCGFRVPAKKGWLHTKDPVHRECDEGVPNVNRDFQRQHNEDLNGPTAHGEDPEAVPAAATVATDPAAYLSSRFQDLWFTEALAVFPAWRAHRVMHVGAAIGYIRTQFLKHGYSPDHVEAYFEAFFDELLDPASSLELREGQTPWQLFTGWWGQHVRSRPGDRAGQAGGD